jgi:hypothetical protein
MSLPVLSEPDGHVFGFPVARTFVESEDDIAAAEQFCREQDVPLLVARCLPGNSPLVHSLTRRGHLLMATQSRYACRLAVAVRKQPDDRYPIRTATAADRDALRDLTREAFAGYPSHYHADPRLDRNRCDEVYVHWVLESLGAQRPGESLFVAERDGQLTGFGLFRLHETGCEALLAGARPGSETTRAFVYRAILREGERRALAGGAIRAFTNVNIDHYAVHHTLIRESWSPVGAIHTFHWWAE